MFLPFLWKKARKEVILEVTVFVTTFNHENYVCDLLDSIELEFLPGTNIIFADLGSSDATLDLIMGHRLYLDNRVKLVSLSLGTSTLTALSRELSGIETRYVVGMSGDDVFYSGYGEIIRNLSVEQESQSVMINVTLIHTDENLLPFKVQRSRWSDFSRWNRYKLNFGNPGTGPGAIYPVSELATVLQKRELAGLLIEDYFIYWQLVDHVKFINLPSAKILYRRHPKALGKQYLNPDYAKSIGFSVGLAFNNSGNALGNLLSVFLFLRWMRHIPLKNLSIFLVGFRTGYKF
jgi:glycosyltransferase involved in cell wall biosynthesis